MIGSLLALVLAVAPAAPDPVDADTVPATPAAPSDCPPKKIYTPRYPADMARKNKSGTAIIEARIDACGRVLEVRLAESAGWPQLNAAALEAVAGFVLPANAVAAAVDGWVNVPIKFGGVRSVPLKKIDWPRSHRRPRYVLDEAGTGFATIAEFEAAKVRDTSTLLQQPYASVRDGAGNLVTTTLYPDREAALTYWFTYRAHAPLPSSPTAPPLPNQAYAIARYRLVQEDGEPIVRLAILCERPAEECVLLRDFLMSGLPFARPR